MNSTFRSKLLPPVEVRGAPLIAMVSALGLVVEAMQRLEVKVEGGKVPKNGGLDEFWCKTWADFWCCRSSKKFMLTSGYHLRIANMEIIWNDPNTWPSHLKGYERILCGTTWNRDKDFPSLQL